jgi:hypothetical protein
MKPESVPFSKAYEFLHYSSPSIRETFVQLENTYIQAITDLLNNKEESLMATRQR